MPKKKISTVGSKKTDSTRKADLFKQIEEQAKRINFLNSSIQQAQDKSVLSSSMEVDFSDHHFDDLFDKMKVSSSTAIIGLLQHKLAEEERVFGNLVKALERVNK
jgi:hemerythrin superfamily protein